MQPSRQSLLSQSLCCLAFGVSTEPALQVGCARPLGLRSHTHSAFRHSHTASCPAHTTGHVHADYSRGRTSPLHLGHSHLHTHSTHLLMLAHTHSQVLTHVHPSGNMPVCVPTASLSVTLTPAH